jgi:uncharacterized protein YpmB
MLKISNSLGISISVIVASIVLSGSLYMIQVNKQESIELQQAEQIKLDALKLKQNECASLAPGVMKKWNNVMGVTYDEKLWEDCVVTYVDSETGEVEVSPLNSMSDN